MRNNVICVNLWGKEICRLEWIGGFKERFGKIGSKVSFNPQYSACGYNLDPLGIYSSDDFSLQAGIPEFASRLIKDHISSQLAAHTDLVKNRGTF